MNLYDLFNEEKVRLDPKCWTGKKIGNPKTKVKGGVRVNNCVPAESVAEEYELAGVGVAYDLGRRAYRERKTIKDNPYSATKEARKYDEWEKGLERGKHDANDARLFRSSVGENAGQPLSVQQLATISDTALDQAYGYGRSTPGNTFGWQANLKSAAYAKQMIDQGITDIEAISDAIHKGWNTTAQAFVQDPEQFDDTAKLAAAGKLEAKLQQRAQLMKQNYGQLPEEEKEKDRVVARALLQAIRGEQGVAEDWKGDLGVQGYAVGGPIGGLVGGAVGELTKEEQLNEFAPLLAAGARLVIAMAPKIAQVLKNTGKATAKAAAPVAKSGAEVAAKNAGQIGVGLGAYEIGSSVAAIAKDITAKVGTALEEQTVMELAQVAFKFAIPAGIVLAILYGGKKVIDSLFSDSKTEQGVVEGQLELNTPDPVVVVQDLKGKILDKINLSVAAQKYKLGPPQNIKTQLAHQNYTTIGNYVIVSPMSGQPQDQTTTGQKQAFTATEGEQKKPKEEKYGPEYDDMVARVKKLAGLGPMKTVYDPAKRVYRNMPTAQQPKK